VGAGLTEKLVDGGVGKAGQDGDLQTKSAAFRKKAALSF
jgi:hypothetical protein